MDGRASLLLKVEEAADELRVGRSKLWELISDGELTAVRIGRATRVTRESIVAYVQRLTADAEGHAPAISHRGARA